MSHDQITAYLQRHNEAIKAGASMPDIGVLEPDEQARVTRFLTHCGLAIHQTGFREPVTGIIQEGEQ